MSDFLLKPKNWRLLALGVVVGISVYGCGAGLAQSPFGPQKSLVSEVQIIEKARSGFHDSEISDIQALIQTNVEASRTWGIGPVEEERTPGGSMYIVSVKGILRPDRPPLPWRNSQRAIGATEPWTDSMTLFYRAADGQLIGSLAGQVTQELEGFLIMPPAPQAWKSGETLHFETKGLPPAGKFRISVTNLSTQKSIEEIVSYSDAPSYGLKLDESKLPDFQSIGRQNFRMVLDMFEDRYRGRFESEFSVGD